MAKSELTKQIELALWNTLKKMGVYICSEVGIGMIGSSREIVDFLSFDSKGIWRCYEIKISKQDFNSNCKHTFVGHFNYYAMTKELYEKIKDKIQHNVGCYILSGDQVYCIKKARKVELGISEEILRYSFMKSLSREFDKVMKKNYKKKIKE